ncbi:regulatory signaling modulator protein AmpE [Spongiibacter sp. KMU-158]|uniref:Regulatory signaling modulator protein AmpE n=1 Tax=Spongiibacter pelagi TaxID=2760804 RepID=A0A927C4T6_9GAMM|nr:regulatory signaling modulator protein AmpE [Spongiibacter pelagi]MBD2859761.1 regulatory signaling modulator protein AmpE [Spongiibacter pelagi]
MEFLAVLIAWGAVQFWGSGGVVQQDGWFGRWREILSAIKLSWLRLFLVVIPPAILAGLLLALFDGVLFGLFELILSVILLLYSLGRGDFQIQLRMYRNSWIHGDLAGAFHHGQGFSVELNEAGAENALELHHSVRRAILYQGFERWFAVVFWFVALGPVAALVYRLLFLISSDKEIEQNERNTVAQILYYFEWTPARLLGFAFGLVGHFECCFGSLSRQFLAPISSIDLLDELADCAVPDVRQNSQVDGEQFMSDALKELDAIQNLLTRSLVCWIAVIAVYQLI